MPWLSTTKACCESNTGVAVLKETEKKLRRVKQPVVPLQLRCLPIFFATSCGRFIAIRPSLHHSLPGRPEIPGECTSVRNLDKVLTKKSVTCCDDLKNLCHKRNPNHCDEKVLSVLYSYPKGSIHLMANAKSLHASRTKEQKVLF